MLIYIEGLSYENFREHSSDIKSSIEEIIRIEELSLTDLSKYLGISRQTLYKYFRHNHRISFRSLNKMNNFLKNYRLKIKELTGSDFISIEDDNGSVN